MARESTGWLPDADDIRRRRILILVIIVMALGAAALLIYTTLADDQQSRKVAGRSQLTREFDLPGQAVDPQAQWISESEKALGEMTKANRELAGSNRKLEQQLQRLQHDFERYRKEQHEANRVAGATAKQRTLPLPPPVNVVLDNTNVRAMTTSEKSTTASNRKRTDFRTTLPAIVPDADVIEVRFRQAEKKTQPHIRNRIPAGSFGKATLLSGLDAPTGALGEQNPHPVLLQLLSHGSLPNRFRHRVRHCRVIASGRGLISDERAHLRLERFSCVLSDGSVISRAVKGFVTGEDGINGLRGRLVSKQGALLARAFMSGLLSGFGDAISQGGSTVSTTAQGPVQTFDPDRIGDRGLASGASSAGNRLADWYMKRANEIYPIIEVQAGRKVDVIFTEDVILDSNLISGHTPS